MVKLSAVELRALMHKKHNIRNMSIYAHVDHGKSTLTDSLVAAAGIETAGDTHSDGSAEYAAISLYHELSHKSLKDYHGKKDGHEFLINLIDSPTDEGVSTALCITDGALVVVDCEQGVGVQAEIQLRKALAERIKPVLTVNKIDRLFLGSNMDGDDAYHKLRFVIESANKMISIATYEDASLGDLQVYPEKGTVAFSAGRDGWAFTLTNFAKMWAAKLGMNEKKLTERLWGENFFDTKTKKWTHKPTGSGSCKRGFVQFVYEPIQEMIKVCMFGHKDRLWAMLANLKCELKADEMGLVGEALMKRTMQAWLPSANALLEMMIFHLPSPATAQKSRVQSLYEGPLDDKYATAIRDCDPDGPLMLYVSRMIPASGKGRFLALGRVFSGKISRGMNVRIMGPQYVCGSKNDLNTKSVPRVMILMGRSPEAEEDHVPCGNVVGLVGLDQFITTSSTLTGRHEVHASRIATCQRPAAKRVLTENVGVMMQRTGFLMERNEYLMEKDKYLTERIEFLGNLVITNEKDKIDQRNLTKEVQLSLTEVQGSLKELKVLSKGWCKQDLKICAGEILKWSVQCQGQSDEDDKEGRLFFKSELAPFVAVGSTVMQMSLLNYKELSVRCIRARNSIAHYRDLATLEAAVLRCRAAMTTFPELIHTYRDQCGVIQRYEEFKNKLPHCFMK